MVVEKTQGKSRGLAVGGSIRHEASALIPERAAFDGSQGELRAEMSVPPKGTRAGGGDGHMMRAGSRIEEIRLQFLRAADGHHGPVQTEIHVFGHRSPNPFFNKGPGVGQQQCRVGTPVRPRPLAGGSVPVPGDFPPGEVMNLPHETEIVLIGKVPQHAGQLHQGDRGIGWTVVLGKPLGFPGEFHETPQTKLAMFPEGGVPKNLSGRHADINPHDGDVGITQPDIALANGIGGQPQSRFHPAEQRVGELARFQDLDKRNRHKVGKIPVGRRHFTNRFLRKPRPDASPVTRRVGFLQRQESFDDGDRLFVTCGLRSRQRGRRIDGGFVNDMNRCAGREPGVIPGGTDLPTQERNRGIEAAVGRRQGAIQRRHFRNGQRVVTLIRGNGCLQENQTLRRLAAC
jgi:hypothetical protein